MNEIHNRRELKAHRKTLAKNVPPTEVVLWRRLRGKRLLGHEFRRQHNVGHYLLDF
jgi:very-short-patch-repair endonuclease